MKPTGRGVVVPNSGSSHLAAAARTVEKSHHVDKDVKQDNKSQFSQAEQVSGIHMHGFKRGATSAHTGH